MPLLGLRPKLIGFGVVMIFWVEWIMVVLFGDATGGLIGHNVSDVDDEKFREREFDPGSLLGVGALGAKWADWTVGTDNVHNDNPDNPVSPVGAVGAVTCWVRREYDLFS